MTFDCELANIRVAVVRGLHCPSSQNLIKKVLHEKTSNSHGLLNPFFRIVGSSVTPQLHIITWDLGNGEEDFVRVAIPQW